MLATAQSLFDLFQQHQSINLDLDYDVCSDGDDGYDDNDDDLYDEYHSTYTYSISPRPRLIHSDSLCPTIPEEESTIDNPLLFSSSPLPPPPPPSSPLKRKSSTSIDEFYERKRVRLEMPDPIPAVSAPSQLSPMEIELELDAQSHLRDARTALCEKLCKKIKSQKSKIEKSSMQTQKRKLETQYKSLVKRKEALIQFSSII